jgi:hypothetical protein
VKHQIRKAVVKVRQRINNDNDNIRKSNIEVMREQSDV